MDVALLKRYIKTGARRTCSIYWPPSKAWPPTAAALTSGNRRRHDVGRGLGRHRRFAECRMKDGTEVFAPTREPMRFVMRMPAPTSS